MTDTTPVTRTNPRWTRWLYPTLAVTGIAAGVFLIVAGVYLLFVHPSSGHSAQPDCCKSMEADMKKMMDDPNMPMKKMMDDPKMPMTSMPPSMPPMSPSMSPMPGMSPTPGMSPMPGMPAPTHTP
jgi:hypothetical protein